MEETKLTVEVDMGKLKAAFALMPKELKHQLGDAFDHISLKLLKNFRAQRLHGRPGVMGHRGTGLFGKFRRASLVSSSLEGMGMIVFSDSKIARLHEEGGDVADPGGFPGKIAVPLRRRTEMFTAEGHLRSRFKNVHNIPGLIIIKSKRSGKSFLAKAPGKWRSRTDGIKTLFVLKDKVTIPARLGFYQTWDDMQNERIMIINKAVDKALEST